MVITVYISIKNMMSYRFVYIKFRTLHPLMYFLNSVSELVAFPVLQICNGHWVSGELVC